MNDYEKALEQIKKQFPVRRMTQTYAQIELDILFDAYNYIFIGVLYENNQILLTDMAEYAEVCQWEDEDIEDIKKICQQYRVIFNNYNIECVYRSNQDVKSYLDCLLALQEKYVEDF